MVSTTTNKTYNDTVNICGQDLEYQIRINGACNSTIDGGFFSDQTNLDTIQIDSLNVNYSVSSAFINWNTSKEANISHYYLIADQGGGYFISDTIAAPDTTHTIQPLPQVTTNYKVISVDSCGNQSSDLLSSPVVIAICSPIFQSNIPIWDTVYASSGNTLLYVVTPNCITTFYWQELKSNSSTWTNIQDNNIYSGSQTSVLIVSNMDSSFHGNKYRCIASGPVGADTSNVTTIYFVNNIGNPESSIDIVKLTPNPNEGFFTLQVSDAFVGAYYEIADGMGRPIERGEIQSKTQDFDLADKPKGVYRITLNGKSANKTMVLIIQ
jgi:hypothetical protein